MYIHINFSIVYTPNNKRKYSMVEETQSLTNPENSMNSLPEKENSVDANLQIDEVSQSTDTKTTTTTTKISEMTAKTVEEISTRVEEVFAKLQKNLEHNTRIFQEKSQGLLSKIDQAEDQIRKVLSQLESVATSSTSSSKKANKNEVPSSEVAVIATESIALSEEINLNPKIEADETTDM